MSVVESYEFTPGAVPELDEPIRRHLAQLILDETLDLPPSTRGNSVRYEGLTDREFIQLYAPVFDILELDPAVDSPPNRTHFDRASKLGLVPSAFALYSRTDLSTVHTEFGFRAKFRFRDWMKSDYIEVGQRLARRVGGRPTRDIIKAASDGYYKSVPEFPTVDELVSRFDNLSTFHELIGYPSCKGWERDDYLDWAHAFYTQNPELEITARALEILSKKGRGPSKQPIIKKGSFGSISAFQDDARENHAQVIELASQEEAERLVQAEELAARDEVVRPLIEEAETTKRILQIAAQYRILKRYSFEDLPSFALQRIAAISEPDVFARRCIADLPSDINTAHIEAAALDLGVFDDLWPMYRFQNVDLRLAA